MKTNHCYQGDCREQMRLMLEQGGAGQVQTVITSPPYFGLRDYGHDGQIGLEQTPEGYIAAMVEVFRCVRELLADDGTLWLNIGDSYNAYKANTGGTKFAGFRNQPEHRQKGYGLEVKTLKNKDLIGIPWMLARALRDPYYTGPVKDVCDQVWLAAMMDAEGSICGTEYQTGDRIKTNIYISITNTSVPVIEKCDRLFQQDMKHIYEKVNGNSNRKCFRWDVERMDQKAIFLRTIYPHLVAKRKQAIIGYTFIEMQRGLVSKKKGYLAEQNEQRSWLMRALSLLNSGQDVDIPDWCIEPPSLFEPGYYLRQDIIWHKPNPMPESVRDRCTKAHEYIFLLSKKEKYYFDADAIKVPASSSFANDKRHKAGSNLNNDKEGYEAAGAQNPKGPHRVFGKSGNKERKQQPSADALNRGAQAGSVPLEGMTANRRSVWTVTTKPFKGAHFATFPQELVEPCILAGSRPNDIVFDPFMGSGTVAEVAQKLGRKWVGTELNPEYIKLQKERTKQQGLVLEVAA